MLDIKHHRPEFFVSVLLLTLGIGFIPVLWLMDKSYIADVHNLCEEKGRLSSSRKMEAKGYLVSRNLMKDHSSSSRFTDLQIIAAELLERRFQFLEMPQAIPADLEPSRGDLIGDLKMLRYLPMFSEAAGSGTRYYRFYLANAGDPACAGFDKEVTSKPWLLTDMHLMGLPVGQCIASIKTDKLLSRYERGLSLVETMRNLMTVNYTWTAHHYILDRNTGKIVTDVFTAGAQIGRNRYGHSVLCGNADQLDLLAKALIPIPSPEMASPNTAFVVDEPPVFPVELEMMADMVSEKDTDKIPVDLGTAYTRPQSTLGGRIFIKGRHLIVIGTGVTKHVLVKAFGTEYPEFQGLTVANDEIVFVSRRPGATRKAKSFVMFRYSMAGDPIAAYEIEAPAFPLDKDILPLINDVKVRGESIEFAITAFHREGDAGVSYKVFNKDYVFHARLDKSPGNDM